MSARCIGCKREIAEKQKICYICGSSQNHLSFYSNNIIALLIVITIASWVSKEIIETKVESLRNTQLLNSQESVDKFDQIQSELSQQITTLENYKELAQLEIEKLRSSIELGSSSSSETLEILEKEKARSKWLSKENRKFSSKIKDLTNHIANLEQKNSLLEVKKLSDQSINIPQAPVETQITPEKTIDGTQPVTEDSENEI
ncbi:MAG: TolA-binding protein [Polaribacter sp.]|jgi:TolA-binding protein